MIILRDEALRNLEEAETLLGLLVELDNKLVEQQQQQHQQQQQQNNFVTNRNIQNSSSNVMYDNDDNNNQPISKNNIDKNDSNNFLIAKYKGILRDIPLHIELMLNGYTSLKQLVRVTQYYLGRLYQYSFHKDELRLSLSYLQDSMDKKEGIDQLSYTSYEFIDCNYRIGCLILRDINGDILNQNQMKTDNNNSINKNYNTNHYPNTNWHNFGIISSNALYLSHNLTLSIHNNEIVNTDKVVMKMNDDENVIPVSKVSITKSHILSAYPVLFQWR